MTYQENQQRFTPDIKERQPLHNEKIFVIGGVSGTGAVNAIVAIQSLNAGKIPHILNLKI